MKKNYLIAVLGFLCCFYSFGFSNLESLNDAAIPNIKVDLVEVEAVCNDTNDYTYNFRIDLCSIHTPDGNPVDFHGYIRPNSDNTWVYLGVPNLVDSNALIYELTFNTNTPFSVETWIMQGFYDYTDPGTIEPWFGYDFCASHRLFEMPEPIGDCSSSACDCINGGEIYYSVDACDASFHFSGFGIDGCATLIQEFTWNFGDDSLEETTTGLPVSTSHSYTENGSYTVTVSFNLQDNVTGELCEVTYDVDIEITDCDKVCTDEPYVEPHWELCETNNVCELDSWPIRVLDGNTPLLLLDGYTFSWTLNGVEISTSDILYGAVEDQTYEVTVTYPNGCEYTISYLEVCCVPEAVTITANGEDITDTLTYTIPCGENCVTINATNVENAVYNTSDPVLTDLNGLFCVPPGSSLTSFTANITGFDTCGDPYSESVTVLIEQDCCLDDISVVFDECPDEEVATLASVNGLESRATNTIVSKSDAERAFTILERSKEALKDCDPCESGVVSTTVVDSNGDPITNFETINVSWAGNPSGVDVNTNQFLVYVDVLYTVTVTVIDPAGHECVYTFDFIYECEDDCLCDDQNIIDFGVTYITDCLYFIGASTDVGCASSDIIEEEFSFTINGGTPIVTTGNGIYQTLSNGTYNITMTWTITDANGCVNTVTESGTFQLDRDGCEGVSDGPVKSRQRSEVTIHPNPNKGQMDINVDVGDSSFMELEIYRYDGLLVKTINKEVSNKDALNFSLNLNLPSGLYLFNFKTANGIITKRVVIE
ncbi:PKD domain-containing protein [uncultured Psychroserpens sp.]|uniref:PKD domain-containing protein n=1 Tax=uncultured Psychroserpens sp. TaxID=255436 RepID=UPI002619B997|nr:PKD domain-containing protein [uncultured Psychroserpens sp.]